MPDPDDLPGQTTTAADSMAKIREAARTKKTLLEVKKLERQLEEPEPEEPAPPKPRLPLPASRTLSIEQLLEYWNGVPKEYRSRLLGYLYRCWPYIQRNPAYIDKIAEPPQNEQEFLRQWGTGEYDLKLTDLDKPKHGEICKARFKFSESFVEYPPVLEVIELDVGRKENRTYIEWLRSKGLLKMPGEQPTNGASDTLIKAFVDMANKQAAPKEPSIEGQAMKQAISIMGDANSAALKMATAQNEPGGIVAILKAAKELQPAPVPQQAPAVDPRVDILLQMQKDQAAQLAAANERHDKLMDRMLEMATKREKPSEDSSLSKMIMEKATGLLFDRLDGGAGRAVRREWWQEMLTDPGTQEILGKFGDALGTFASGFAMSRMKPGQQPPPPPQARPTLINRPGLEPPTATQEQADATPTPQGDPMILQTLFTFFSPRFDAMMNMLNYEARGEEFADWCAQGGMTLLDHGQLKEIGRDKILDLVKQTPRWPQVKPVEAKFGKFVDEFLSWTPNWEDSLPPEGPEEVPPPPPKRPA